MTLDDLEDYGMERMDETEIRNFLSDQGVGVLGVPADGAPYVVPLSFGFDGVSELYFTFVVGSESRKEELIERADDVSFLVYEATSPFSWESVVLTGPLGQLPEGSYDEYEAATDNAWRPDLLRSAGADGTVELYRFSPETWSGIKHTGLPAGFERDA